MAEELYKALYKNFPCGMFKGRKVDFIAEPGQYMSMTAGTLVACVIGKKPLRKSTNSVHSTSENNVNSCCELSTDATNGAIIPDECPEVGYFVSESLFGSFNFYVYFNSPLLAYPVKLVQSVCSLQICVKYLQG